jgi:hypothetical protein
LLVNLGGPFGEPVTAEVGRFFGGKSIPNDDFLAAAIGLIMLVVWVGAVAIVARRFEGVRTAVVAIICIFAFSFLSAVADVWAGAGVGREDAGGATATLSAIFLALWITRGRLLVSATLHAAITVGLLFVASAQLHLFQ